MIYLLGDIGQYNQELKKLVKKMKKNLKPKDTIILLGDNFYPMGVTSVTDTKWKHYKQMFNFDNKVYSILGNHDYQLNPKAQIDFKYKNYQMKNWFYKKKIENIDFFFIDTTSLITLGYAPPSHWGHVTEKLIEEIHNKPFEEIRNEQLDWLKKNLKNSKLPKIVLGHYPIITYGSHYGECDELYKLLFPIFKKYNVLAYFSGHDHNIQHNIIKKNRYVLHNIIGGSSSKLNNINNNTPNSKNFFWGKTNCLLRFDPKSFEFQVLDKDKIILSSKI